MTAVTLKKSSFTLSVSELPLVKQLKKTLKLKSNTAVIRQALLELQKKIDRQTLREQCRYAIKIVSADLKEELNDLDSLTSEGLSEA